MEIWQLQEAKNKFSELVEHALHDGPQLVTRDIKDFTGKLERIVNSFAPL